MLLINTSSLKLEEFFEEKIPKYAILSHTWAEGEISYKDFVKNRNLDAAGWTKIRNCCKFAHNRGHNYVWIDTCCIDKRSSAELSEAINSMYRWYQQAKVCYAYLSDVSYDEGFEHEGENGSANEVDVKNNDNIEDEIEDADKTNPDDDLEDSNDEMLSRMEKSPTICLNTSSVPSVPASGLLEDGHFRNCLLRTMSILLIGAGEKF